MVKKPKERNILVAPNRNLSKKKKINKPALKSKRNTKSNKSYSLISSFKNFVTNIIKAILNLTFRLLFWVIFRILIVVFLFLPFLYSFKVRKSGDKLGMLAIFWDD